jgi:hypothetical protein
MIREDTAKTSCDNLIPGMALWNKICLHVHWRLLSPSKYSPCEDMHFVRLWYQGQKQSWKSISRIRRSNVTLLWISGMAANLCPLWAFFNILKGKKSQGAKSGK